MRPTLLKPGDEVLCSGIKYVSVFVKRIQSERSPSSRPKNFFRCDALRGLDGPDDEGLFEMSDYEVSRQCVRAAVKGAS